MSLPAVDINWVHVLVASLVPMAAGFAWYSMAMFGKPWMRLSGLTKEDIGNGPGMGYALTMVAALIQAYVMAHFVQYVGAETASAGATTGLWIGLGFVVTAFAVDFIFNQKPRQLLWITAGYHVASLTLMGALLAAWQ